MKPPSSRTPRKAASSLGMSGPYSALTSTSGIFCIRLNFSLRPPAVDQIRGQEHDRSRDGVLEEAESVIGAVVRGSEPITGAGEADRPHRGTDEREERVRPQ